MGMLIPPSVLMIVWGILTEQSIGRLFLAGVLPGILLATLFILYLVVRALTKPELVGEGAAHVAGPLGGELTGEILGIGFRVHGSVGAS